MGKLALTTTMTIDGVIDVSEWYVAEGEHDRAALDDFHRAAAMVLGRKSYEGFAGFWPTMTGDWADRLNEMPKYVASRTLEGPLTWNAQLIEGDAAEGVARLKNEVDGDLIMSGCGEFARFLLHRGLIDELRFWIHPSVWGEGQRPFHGGGKARLRPIESTTFDSGVTLLRYEPVR
jgi:dihydrofolate reductase